jgi:uridine kinase
VYGSEIPIYRFETNRREGSGTCKPAPIIVVEGVFAFANERLRKEFDVKVWIEASYNRRYERRITRDTQERSRDLQEIIDRYAEDVDPGYQKFVQPLREHADIIFQNNGRNREVEPILLNMLLSYVERLSYTDD